MWILREPRSEFIHVKTYSAHIKQFQQCVLYIFLHIHIIHTTRNIKKYSPLLKLLKLFHIFDQLLYGLVIFPHLRRTRTYISN
ncbi:hypothetical protein BRC82_08430 [Halobacteriales archaeon QS_1_67_19]|nr:MAG: hypothetical protein BRC82_08430 [Halobacteriales archaeon QS_1_67_19]